MEVRFTISESLSDAQEHASKNEERRGNLPGLHFTTYCNGMRGNEFELWYRQV